MPTIQLLIPDHALNSALLEQLQSAGLGKAEIAKDIPAAIQSDDTLALILDAPAADKKILKLLSDAASTGKKKRLFILGECGKEWDGDLITESFAKPLRLGHLLARLQFYLQSAPRLSNTPIIFGPYLFEPQNRQVIEQNSGSVIRLTEKETALLDQLIQAENPVTREELLASIWGYGAQIETHTLETHIYQLRRKLDPQGTGENWLINEQGSYRLKREKDAA